MGIDYGNGLTNVSGITVPAKEECIRFGVISQHEVLQAWCDESEADYGRPHCPKCGAELHGDGHLNVGEIVVIDGVKDGTAQGAITKITDTSVFIDIDGRTYRRDFEDVYPTEEEEICDGHECECGYVIKWVGEECYGGEPLGHYVNGGEYEASSDSYGDIFITDSPYYTRCGYCSPCAPGAGYLTDNGDDCYAFCFGPDWFDDECPYPVWRVSDGKLIYIPCEAFADEQDEPMWEDFTITPCGSLGGKSALGRVDGRFIGEFDCDDDAIAAAQRIMTAERYWPNIWIVSDHGNWTLYTGE